MNVELKKKEKKNVSYIFLFYPIIYKYVKRKAKPFRNEQNCRRFLCADKNGQEMKKTKYIQYIHIAVAQLCRLLG